MAESDRAAFVEKRIFELPSFTTVSGQTINAVRVGWESYGTLNADKSNAILINHYFSGTSHAAGRYSANDLALGYWDDLIGPGKAIDTDRFFVLSSDTLVNLNARDPNVVTTGPASINPATGKPYGLDFPIVTIADFVAVQKALVDSLGITKLHGVMGPSMGGLQTYEWAASYPDMMSRIICVISSGVVDPWLAAWLEIWGSPIRQDLKWRNGTYDPQDPPLEGLTQALKIVSLHALHWDWARGQFGSGESGQMPARDGQSLLESLDARVAIDATLQVAAAARALTCDANHFLYLVRANQTFVAGLGATCRETAGHPQSAKDAVGRGVSSAPAEGLARIKVPALLLYAPGDQVFPESWIHETARRIEAGGASVETAAIPGPLGHLNGVSGMRPVAGQIQEFLTRA